MSSILNNAQNNNFTNNTFVNNAKTGPSLEVLYERVAPNAILNAGGRADEVRCHPGTREEVIGRIEKWRTDAQAGVTASRMFWLSGPAGAGKTAIVQTVAESWTSRGVHAANFFFFRTDASRNHAKPLVSTLLYQIFDFYPTVRGAVGEILASKPRILDASIEEQFNQLICIPFRSIGPSFSQSTVILIDGLDECDSVEKTSQRQILRALDTLVGRNDLPFLVLVASRVEHQITMAFNQVCSKVDSIFLDDEYSPQKDINLFVTAEFSKIKTTHHLAHTLDKDWPSASDIDGIVAKSSGQFIYAATVMRFISDSSASPKLSLQRVQGIAKATTSSPFSDLDALYTYILSRADDQQTLQDILHAHFCVAAFYDFWLSDVNVQTVLSNYDGRYTDSSVIHSCIADLTSISRFENDRLIFYHASLPDYFDDQSRSGEYFVDKEAFRVKLAPRLWERAQYKDLQLSRMVCAFMPLTMTPDIMSVLLRVAPEVLHHLFCSFVLKNKTNIFREIHRMCVWGDDVANYKRILQRYTDYYLSIPDIPMKLASELVDEIPCVQRYLMMSQIELLHGDISQEPDIVVDALRPESASDAHDISLWIQNLLQRIHGKHYILRRATYKRLIKQWISWAVANDVPLSDLHDLPNGRLYLRQSTKKKQIANGSKPVRRI